MIIIYTTNVIIFIDTITTICTFIILTISYCIIIISFLQFSQLYRWLK